MLLDIISSICYLVLLIFYLPSLVSTEIDKNEFKFTEKTLIQISYILRIFISLAVSSGVCHLYAILNAGSNGTEIYVILIYSFISYYLIINEKLKTK